MAYRDPVERFHSRYMPDPNSGCWLWDGGLTKAGYARYYAYGRPVYAHRFSYELAKGKIPDGLSIDHLCRMTSCVNPDHLEAVTHSINMKRGRCADHFVAKNMAKTHCPAGHEYSRENIYWDYRGHRTCRECSRVRVRNRRAAERNRHGLSAS